MKDSSAFLVNQTKIRANEMQWTTDTTYVLGAGVGSSYALAVSNTTVIMIPQGVRGMLLVFVAPQRPPSCTIDFPSPHVRPNAVVHAGAPLRARGRSGWG